MISANCLVNKRDVVTAINCAAETAPKHGNVKEALKKVSNIIYYMDDVGLVKIDDNVMLIQNSEKFLEMSKEYEKFLNKRQCIAIREAIDRHGLDYVMDRINDMLPPESRVIETNDNTENKR